MIIYKVLYRLMLEANSVMSRFLCIVHFIGNGIKFSSFRTNGVPYIMVSRGGRMEIGGRFAMNNGIHGNPIGCYDKCTFFVGPNATISIGHDTGISQSALVAISDLHIGSYVKIGGVRQFIHLTSTRLTRA